MTIATLPLDEVAQRIRHRQAELEALRRDYETRQAQLVKLNRRKQELQDQLARVERDIQAANRRQVPGSTETTASPPASVPKPKMTATSGKPAAAPSLTQFLVDHVRQAKQPVTVKQLVQEAQRRQVPTQSSNLRAVIKSRVQDLVRRGVLRRAKDQPGVVLAEAVQRPPTGPRLAPPKPAKAQPTATKPSRTPSPSSEKQATLHEVLTKVLQNSPRPLDGQALARQAKAAGYRSKSKDFANVIYVRMGQMDNVEHVPGQGYRLKKR